MSSAVASCTTRVLPDRPKRSARPSPSSAASRLGAVSVATFHGSPPPSSGCLPRSPVRGAQNSRFPAFCAGSVTTASAGIGAACLKTSFVSAPRPPATGRTAPAPQVLHLRQRRGPKTAVAHPGARRHPAQARQANRPAPRRPSSLPPPHARATGKALRRTDRTPHPPAPCRRTRRTSLSRTVSDLSETALRLSCAHLHPLR
jgi:hypothetical protein